MRRWKPHARVTRGAGLPWWHLKCVHWPSASHEQAQGIEQINLAVGQMDRITRENSSIVQGSAQASTQLSGLALELSGIVRQFKLAR